MDSEMSPLGTHLNSLLENLARNGLGDFFGVGLVVVCAMTLGVVGLVHREIGRGEGLGPGGRWMLSLALGMGVLAFALKLGVALALGSLPEASLAHPLQAPLQAPFQAAGRAPGSEPDHLPAFLLAVPGPGEAYVWQTLPAVAPAPPDNPTTPARVALGERLFRETRLSGDGRLSCASCHDLMGHGGSDGRATAQGIGGQVGGRNVPTVWNSGFQAVLFWDGRAASLEQQAQGPILNPMEMGLPDPALAEQRLGADASYRRAFAQAFGDPEVRFQRIAMALAAYERTLIAADTPYDRFVQGNEEALSPSARRGMALFESLGCVLCHRGPNFSDASLLGGQNPYRVFPANPIPEEDRYDLLLPSGQRGVWRVPSLRNVALTGPWLHNGRVDKLADVVRLMARAQLGRTGGYRAWLGTGGGLNQLDRRALSDGEVGDLVAFLESLSSDTLVRSAVVAGH